jgi:hypothetical protein
VVKLTELVDRRSDNISTLKRETIHLSNLFEQRISQLRNRTDLTATIKQLPEVVIPNFESVLPSMRVAVGIDGSMDYDEVLEMLLFYVVSSGYECDFTITEQGIPEFDLAKAHRSEQLTMSAVVPLWREDLLNVAESSKPLETEFDFRSNLERIPFALMTMSELYLTLQIIRGGKTGIIFLDRPFSGTYPSLYRDLAFVLQRKTPTLVGTITSHGIVTKQDLQLASIIGPGTFYIPKRSSFLHYAAIKELLNGDMKKTELAKRLSLSDADLNETIRRLRGIHRRYESELLGTDDLETIGLREEAKKFWARTEEMTFRYAERIFNTPSDVQHPLMVHDNNWLSVIDLNALNLFLLQTMMHEARKRRILIIGVAKDTTSTDFTRSALPLELKRKATANLPGLKSDKALLTIISTVNADKIATPWRTFSYDAAHTTMVLGEDGLKAARRKISRELFFIRQYFQLRTFTRDPEIRAPVFLFDRMYNAEFDDTYVESYEASEQKKPTQVRLFMEPESRRSTIDDVCLLVLSRCDNPEVLEAYGHNQLLYLADKFVKHEVQLTKGLLRGLVDLQLTPLARRQKVFSIARRFRDLRAESESSRKAAVSTRQEIAR